MHPGKTVGILLLLALLYAVPNAFALGRGENADQPKGVEVTGRVRLVGNSPMSSLVITGEEREWHIDQGEQKKLMDLQHRVVTVRAREYYYDMFFANGLPAGRRYFLRNITVIRSEN